MRFFRNVRRIRSSSVVGRAGQQRQRQAATYGESAFAPVGNAVLGVPCRSAHVFHNFGRIRSRFPVGKGLAPSGRKCSVVRQPWAKSQTCSAFAQGFPVSAHVLHGKGKPFPYNQMLRIRRTWQPVLAAAARRAGVGAPYRFRFANSPDGLLRLSAAAGDVEDAVPYRTCADLPKVEPSRSHVLRGTWRTPSPAYKCCEFAERGRLSKAPSPLPSPSGGGCRPQGRPERENVTGPQCENDRNRGECANDFTVCWRSRSPSSVIRLCRMPPSPAGGRKGRIRSRLRIRPT